MRYVIALMVVGCGAPPKPPPAPPPPPPVYAIEFEVKESNLTTGDDIQITTIHGDKPGCLGGGTYAISGRYTLASRSDAELVVGGHRGGMPGQEVVQRGSGDFSFKIDMVKDGPIEASFSKVGGGSSTGGIVIQCSKATPVQQ
jgi:hypothetical protein